MKQRTAPTVTLVTSIALLVSLLSSIPLAQPTAAESVKFEQETFARQYPTLRKYCADLTVLARQGKLEPRSEYAAAVARVIDSLAAAKNPVVIGDAELERDAIARGLAVSIARDEVPAELRGKRVLRLSLEALARDARTSANFVSRVQAVFAEAAQARHEVILFVDQLHQYAGSRAETLASVAVKTALEANHLQVLGGESATAYAAYIASDRELGQLFAAVSLEETEKAAVQEDRRRSPIKEEFVGENISPDMRELMKQSGADGRVTAILQVDDVNGKEVRAQLSRYGVTINERMPTVGAMKVELPVKAIEALMKSGSMNYISPDAKLQSFGHVTATTGTDLIRTQTTTTTGLLGLKTTTTTTFDGSGIGIAIIDSGVDNNHDAFANSRIRLNKDFTSQNLTSIDPYGHGSHVAASAAGVSTSGSGYQGIAPGANIINLRVLDQNGEGTASTLLSALNWILAPADPTKPVGSNNPLNKDKYGIRIVNLSLGASAIDSYKNDPVCRAARALVDAGIVVVAAAGNNGKDANGTKIYGMIHAPGDEPSVITVGAANTFGTDARSDDGVTTYSSRGPTRGSYTDTNGVRHYDNLLKPDLVAPGNKLIFAESDIGGCDGLLLGIGYQSADGNNLVNQHPELDSGITDDNHRRLMFLSGSSMAAPVVSGAAALLLQANPKLTPNLVKMILMYTAGPLKGFNLLEQGTGEVNVEGAMRLAKLVRTDLTPTTPKDSPMLTGPAPDPHTTIAGQTFSWAQGIVLKHWYATGSALETKYQPYYAQGVVLGDGIMVTDGIILGDGVVLGDNVVLPDGVVLGDNIMTSNGVVLGDGTLFCSGVVLGDGIMVTDGIILGDGVVLGDATVMGEGIISGDSTVQALANQAMIYGDPGPYMK
jgi:serine protease AprX